MDDKDESDPCLEVLHRFLENEELKGGREEAEAIVLVAIVFLIITCLLLSVATEITAMLATLVEAATLSFHQRKVFLRLFAKIMRRS